MAKKVLVEWTDSTGNTLAPTHYEVERKTGSGGTYVKLGSNVANGVEEYDDQSVIGDATQYYYRVAAVFASGNKIYVESSITISGGVTVPDPDNIFPNQTLVDTDEDGRADSIGSSANYTFTMSGAGTVGNIQKAEITTNYNSFNLIPDELIKDATDYTVTMTYRTSGLSTKTLSVLYGSGTSATIPNSTGWTTATFTVSNASGSTKNYIAMALGTTGNWIEFENVIIKEVV